MIRIYTRGLPVVVVGLFALVAPTHARAQSDGHGLELGLRAGVGLPLGKLNERADLSDAIASQIALGLDLGYRFDPHFFAGAYARYGFGFVGGTLSMECDSTPEVDCSASDVAIGLQVHYHLVPDSFANPWAGVGAGYEWMRLGESAANNKTSITTRGFEFLELQLGLDLNVASHLTFGPFVDVALGKYTDISFDCDQATCVLDSRGGEIANKAMHGWFEVGVRATYF